MVDTRHGRHESVSNGLCKECGNGDDSLKQLDLSPVEGISTVYDCIELSEDEKDVMVEGKRCTHSDCHLQQISRTGSVMASHSCWSSFTGTSGAIEGEEDGV